MDSVQSEMEWAQLKPTLLLPLSLIRSGLEGCGHPPGPEERRLLP